MEQQNQTQSLDLAATQKQIEQGIEKVKMVEAKIAEFREKSTAIAIADENDKEGYKIATEFLREVRTTRTGLEAERKMVTKPITEFKKAVDEAYNKCTDACAEIEAPIKARKDEIDQIKEEEKKRKEEEIAMRLNARISALQESGCTLVDGYWCVGNFSVGVVDIQNITDEMFLNNVLPVAVKNHQEALEAKRKEEEAIAEAKRKEEEGKRKMQEELEAIRKEKLELRKGVLEALAMPHSLTDDMIATFTQEQWQTAITTIKDAHNARLEAQKVLEEANRIKAEKQAKIEARKAILPDAPLDVLANYTDVQFSLYVEEVKAKREEENRFNALIQARGQRLNDIGLHYSFSDKLYLYGGVHIVDLNTIQSVTDGEFEALLKEYTKYIAQRKMEAETARKEAEAKEEQERLNALSDKKKIAEFAQAVLVESKKINLKKNQEEFERRVQDFILSLKPLLP
jgi:hypothetical protein